MKTEPQKNTSKKIHIILIFVIIIQLIRIIYSFSFLKEDFHSDEPWSYGLSNSYFEPYIFQNADETKLTHINEWFSSDEFKDYLTVSSNQRFSYKSVFYNQSMDLHPPLYYLILHTICSFFPEKFSFWYGFSINIAVFLLLQFFLYKLTLELSESQITALSTCIFYGFSPGALNTFVFVRMYALLTVIGVTTAYLHTRLLKTDKFKSHLTGIFFITLAGALTHHFFLAYAGTLSACFCFFYLFKKEIKKLFAYALTLLCSVGMSVIIFPATINHLFGRRGEITKFESAWQFKYSINSVLNELFGLNISLFKKPDAAIAAMFAGAAILLLLPVCFLFRNEKWFKNLIAKTKVILRILPSKIKLHPKEPHFMVLFLAITSLMVIIVTALSVSAVNMFKYIDRYNFIIFPLVCLEFTYLLSFILRKFILRKKISISASVVFALIAIINTASNIQYPCYYLFEKESVIPLSDVLEGSNIIYISNEHWLLTSFSNICLDSGMFYSTTPEQLRNSEAELSFPDNSNPVYLIIKEECLDDGTKKEETVSQNALPDFIRESDLLTTDELKNILNSSFDSYDFTYKGKDSVFTRDVLVYRLR